MSDLFALDNSQYRPLADRMRPASLESYFGQTHLLGEGKPLRKAIQNDHIHSMILWGPPGVGKTTLAKIISSETKCHFISISAIMSGIKEIRNTVSEAQQYRVNGKKTVLFVDEVHRFNKSQQDAFLPHVEDGTFIFIGATTENPSFELNNALLSRSRVYKLSALENDELVRLVDLALSDREKGLGSRNITISEDARELLVKSCYGDSRRLLNHLEIAADFVSDNGSIETTHIYEVIGSSAKMFDKGGDIFYEQISALHKSVRGSDPDASLFWFCSMLEGGCDPLYIARRIVRMASEDIGNAEPRALTLALNAWDVQKRLGSPEGELAMAQAVTFLASAPKSNAVYQAYNSARAFAKSSNSDDVPVHLRNAPSKLMKELGYGKAYRYSHDEPEAFSAGQSYWPDTIVPQEFYQPVSRGLEIQIKQKLEHLKKLNKSAKGDN
ncbi:MAG: replication-associated recombination protein A [Gammaproteobacteria bacterium]|nr:replication-associated recombination protein A [Gammaproteobacteria bacterium]